MNCQDIQHLLPFVNRSSAELDAAEREAMKQHLEKCPECAELAQAERRADEAIGTVMRDVAAPAGLKEKVIARLSAERAAVPWKWGGSIVLAATLLIAASLTWYMRPLPKVSYDDVLELDQRGPGWSEEQVVKHFAERGLSVEAPSDFDPEWLRQLDVVEFKDRRVAKLTFQREFDQDRRVRADVLILPHSQFNVEQLRDGTFQNLNNLQILRKENYTYLIFYNGQLELIRRQRF